MQFSLFKGKISVKIWLHLQSRNLRILKVVWQRPLADVFGHLVMSFSVTRFGDLLDFGLLFKVFGNN